MALSGYDIEKSVVISPSSGLVPSTVSGSFPLLLSASAGVNNYDATPIFDALTPLDPSDNFTGNDGDSPNPVLWDVDTTKFSIAEPTWSMDATVEISSNTLTITPTTTSDYKGVESPYFFDSGEFEIEIDLTTISSSGRIFLQLIDENYTSSTGKRTYVGFNNSLGYFAVGQKEDGVSSSYVASANSNLAATIKIARDSSDNLLFYVDDVLFSNADFTQSGTIYIMLFAQYYEGAFDNFTVNSGTVVWPYVPKQLAIEIGDTGTQCDIDIVTGDWDADTQTATIYPDLASLSDGDTFRLYYDNAAAENVNITEVASAPAAPGGGDALTVWNLAVAESLWLWGVGLSIYRNGLEVAWGAGSSFINGLEITWANAVAAGLNIAWSRSSSFAGGLSIVWRDGYILRNGLEISWGKGKSYRGGLELSWHSLGAWRNGLALVWPDLGNTYRNGLGISWDVLERDLFRAGLHLLWWGGANVDQRYQVTLTMAGETISPAEIRIRRSRDEYVVSASLAMAGDPDLLPGEILPKGYRYAYLDAADQAAARAAAAIEISIAVNNVVVETVQLLATSITDTITVEGTDYTLVAESAGVLLDAPYSLPLTTEYGPGLVSELAGQLVASQPFSLSWDTTDWWITGGVWYGNGETLLDIIRKPKAAIGAMLQSDLAGDLSVKQYYPLSRKDWQAAAAEYLVYGENFFSHSRSDIDRSDYNSFLIGDQLAASNSLAYEENDLDHGVKEILAYVVPFTDEELPLQTSGPDRVVIEAGRIVSKTIEAEQVEIVGGQGRTQKPIYRIIDRDYGENTQLGAISYGEDGAIATEIAGQSICLITYETKYWRWLVRDSVDEDVQFFTLPGWADTAIALVVTFGDAAAASGFVVAEPDETLNVDVDGNVLSELPPGQPFYFLLQHDDTIRVETVTVSSGVVANRGRVTRAKKGQLQFPDGSGIELPYFPAGGVDVDWDGRSPQLSVDGRKLKAASYPAIGDAAYDAELTSYRLTPPAMSLAAEEKYYILINIKMVSV